MPRRNKGLLHGAKLVIASGARRIIGRVIVSCERPEPLDDDVTSSTKNKSGRRRAIARGAPGTRAPRFEHSTDFQTPAHSPSSLLSSSFFRQSFRLFFFSFTRVSRVNISGGSRGRKLEKPAFYVTRHVRGDVTLQFHEEFARTTKIMRLPLAQR